MKFSVFLLVAVPLCSAEVFFRNAEFGRNEILHSSQDANIAQIRYRRHAAPPPPEPQINYRPYSQAPAQIQHLLQSQQAREQISHIAAQAPPQLSRAPSAAHQPQYQNQKQSQAPQYNPQVQYNKAPQQAQYQAPQHVRPQPSPAQYRPQYQPAAQSPAQYSPQHRPAPQQAQYSQPAQPNHAASYRPIPQAPASNGPQPSYSNNLPPQIQQLLQAQAQLPNSIPTGHQAGPPPSNVFRPEQSRLY